MARRDRRMSVLIPEAKRAQYEDLARNMHVSLSALGEMLMSVGYDHILRKQEQHARDSE